MKTSRNKVVFKDYHPNQLYLLPPSLGDMIQPNHPVRVVNQVVDSINVDTLLNQYKGGGDLQLPPAHAFKSINIQLLVQYF